MVAPAVKREAVAHLKSLFGLSERRACRIAGADRKMIRYQSIRPPETELRHRLRDLANERRRFGYRRLFVLLRRDGEPRWLPTPTLGRRNPPKLECVSQPAEQCRSVDRQRQPGEALRIDMVLYGLTGSRGQSSEQGLDVTTNRFQQSELKRLLISNCLSRLV